MTYLTAELLRKVHAMSERELQAEVRQMCTDRGYIVQHMERADLAQAWQPGWMDLDIIGPGGRLARELKDQRGYPSLAQLQVGAAINRSGGNWGVWKPSDFWNGRIALELDAIS